MYRTISIRLVTRLNLSLKVAFCFALYALTFCTRAFGLVFAWLYVTVLMGGYV